MLGLPIYAMLPNDYSALYDSLLRGQAACPGSHLGQQIARLSAKIAGTQDGTAEKESSRMFG